MQNRYQGGKERWSMQSRCNFFYEHRLGPTQKKQSNINWFNERREGGNKGWGRTDRRVES